MDDAPRISIVDDDPLVRSALCRLCKSVGYEVAAYESAEAFLECESSPQAGCLVLDVHLPGRSGLELQAELQAAKNPLPIIFVTAYEDEEAKTQALDRGAVDFLRKPLDTERLLLVIEQALKAGER
jgi:FixJ family two-component response regulator